MLTHSTTLHMRAFCTRALYTCEVRELAGAPSVRGNL
jgi:hypothetical protein